ncbi:CBS domain-containing protein [Roseiarcaceae bacterium H3SJ34-1]|uniref:CBS domain-containing protein n=1 Tax=Terripilifer ovatus TaxID=3032367 RepID=UPI003AB97211|nr:CBS domain-containing protein [Roseiarcaceae bacterium H3SJ34-1]
MKAADVMTERVLSVWPEASITMAAKIMSENRISALPVTDSEDRILGIVSEGDLIRRVEIGTTKRHSWWSDFWSGPAPAALDFVKSRARRVSDVMTRDVVSVPEDAPLEEVATLMERRQVKRLPVVRDGKVVGIVSRANLIRALANIPQPLSPVLDSDLNLQKRVIENLKSQPFGKPWLISASVLDGVVTLWGPVSSKGEQQALRIAAETTPGVRDVKDYTMFMLAPVVV